MQTEMINLTEQPHHLSDELRHCLCPHATSGGSVCASPQAGNLLAVMQTALVFLSRECVFALH